MGVSAKGKAILVASKEISTCSEGFVGAECSVGFNALPEGSASVSLCSVILLSFCLLFFTFIGCGSGSIWSPLCRGLLLLFLLSTGSFCTGSSCTGSSCSVTILSVGSRDFFVDRFAGGGLIFSGDSSSMGSGGFANSALAFLERVRAKENPSSSSS